MKALDKLFPPIGGIAPPYNPAPHYEEKRDYFAASALTGMQIWDAVLNNKSAQFSAGNGGVKLLAETAYLVADAMMEARSKK